MTNPNAAHDQRVHDIAATLRPAGYMPPADWRERIRIAAEARELGARLRAGKPASLRPLPGRAPSTW
jgi:hypothetical protein